MLLVQVKFKSIFDFMIRGVHGWVGLMGFRDWPRTKVVTTQPLYFWVRTDRRVEMREGGEER